ncbi:MAG: DEAD/DEAH box helicase [Candidatus Dormibacteraeota bacterium]|uniref:DEAD/DEAH box helicase n=1 Tax=Candidatus Dormiibacter inghamiae TaxID=3127013 RepID=A0A934KG91_9BACT|nr:DEAD/DEAH box helicase [Candidatus Dormibacteraeota bacterium]MBJ7606417.1 DEAD/DEAH box helicase [Candidatus Dormibacteraeota bacterium]
MPNVPAFDPSAFSGEVTLDHVTPARAAEFAPLPGDLEPSLRVALGRCGITQLYSHQADAYRHVRAGRHLVVVTPTASGKTLCYNLPVLQRILERPAARALYLFPTKALAQDQLAELGQLGAGLSVEIKVDVYDGDTPAGQRKAIRDGGHVVLTNPEMLHTGILPHHTGWRRLFSSLEYVVIDELHTYRGLFGSQVANVIRRLKRICEFYGASPQFVCASATIANPSELAGRLLEEENLALVARSGAPQGERRLIFYNPPLTNRALGVRRSSLLEARRIAAGWIGRQVQTIVFCRSRLQVEVMTSYLQEALLPRTDAKRRVRGYRSGYLPLRRREIEAGLRSGEVWGVVSTNALELGIDIGSLQAAVIVGYPGTIASTWQQLGRAGRRSGSVAVFVASGAPLDQFIVRHPEYFLEAAPEEGLIDPDNPLVLAGHLQAGLFELPFSEGEKLGRGQVAEMLELFQEDGVVSRSGGRWFWSADAFPAEGISLRRLAADNVVIVDTSPARPQVIGEMDQFSAQVMLHEEAIYLQEGAQYHVDRLDWDEKKAYLRPVEVDYYTDALLAVSVNVLDCFESGSPAPLDRSHGEVKLTALATLFKKIRFHTHENIGSGPIRLPEQTLHTTAYWTSLEPDYWLRLGRECLEAGLQGMAHAMRTVAAVRLMCDPRDLGSTAEVKAISTLRPTVTIYEVYPGGVGYAKRLFELHEQLLADAAQLVEECPCPHGCPSCIGPLWQVEGAKQACLQLLSAHVSLVS